MSVFAKKILPVLLSVLMFAGAVALPVQAAVIGEAKSEISSGQTVISVSTGDIESLGFCQAVQSALDNAKNNAASTNIYKIVVTPGSYSADRALRIYSNTTLELNGVTIKRTRGDVNMLRTGSEDSLNSGAVGYAYENITVSGGTFDGNNGSGTILKAAHAKNFKMTNVTLKNEKEGHIMEAAGIDGFTVRGCTFKDQILSANGIGFEALQFDILKSGHIVNCRSEDLNMKNILVENCTFDNCPRGLGTHTGILNNPFDGVIIRNNTFKNIKSAAIQGMNWINAEITGNVIDGASRGISVYSILNQGNGMYLSSDIAREGATNTHVSDNYQTPKKANIVIANNVLKNIGNVKDIYSSYECSGIAVIGYKLDKVYSKYSDGSGALPKGDYYNDGVTVRDNLINVSGHGIRIEDARNAAVNSNTIYCSANTVYPANYYGIVLRENVSGPTVKNNTIENAQVNGIQVVDSAITEISYNRVNKTGKYGIGTYGTKLASVSNNDILNTPNQGIVLIDASSASSVSNNRVSGAKSYGLYFTSDSSAASVSGNTTLNCTDSIGYTKSKNLVKVGTNYTSSAALSSFKLEDAGVKMGVGKSYKFLVTIAPVNAVTSFTYTSANSKIAEVERSGRITAKAVGSTYVTVRSANGKTAVFDVEVASGGEPQLTKPKKLAAPKITNLECVDGGIKITWDKVAGATGYRLYYKTADGGWKRFKDTTSTSFIDTGVKVGRTETYTIRTLGADGEPNSDYVQSGWSITYTYPYAAPKITKLECVDGGIKITWDKVAGATGYRLYYKTADGGWKRFKDTTSTSFIDTGVKAGRTETYTIRTLGANGEPNSDYNHSGWSITYQIGAPQVTGIESTNSGVLIKWKAVSGVAAYKVFYKNSKGGWTGLGKTSSTSLTDKDVKSGGTYTYTVRGLDKNGNYITSYNSTGWRFTYIGTPSITGTESVINGVKLSWNSVKGATGYKVFYKNSRGNWVSLGTVRGTSFVDTDVRSGSTYTYTVRCVDANGSYCSGYNNTGWKATFVAAPSVTEIKCAEKGIYLKWNAVKGASKYRVFYYGKNGWTRVGTTSSTSFTDSDVKSGTTYRYTVRCLDSKDNFVSAYNTTGWSIKYISAPNFNLTSKLGGVKISWNAVNGAEKYRIFYKNKNGNWVTIADTVSTSYLDSDVSSGKSYTYTVRCLSADGKFYTSSYISSGKAIKYINPELNFTDKQKQAAVVAKDIINTIPKNVSDFERIRYAAATVAYFCDRCVYTSEGSDYSQPYGVFVKGEYTCAGSTRALGLLLDYMGYDWEHINENQWTHQWCELMLDGKKVWADGQGGLCGYGEYPGILFYDDDFEYYYYYYVQHKK